jgi:hypothetical protein
MPMTKRRTEIRSRPVKSKPKKLDAIAAEGHAPPPERRVVHRNEPTTRELINVVTDSIERLYEEFGQNLDRMNSEDKALILVRYLKHGITSEGLDTPPRISQREMKAPPLCRNCEA